MFKKIVSVSAVTAMLVLSGCSGDNTEVAPETSTPNGSNAKLQKQIDNFKATGGTKESFNHLGHLGNENSINDLGIDLSKFFGFGGGHGGQAAMASVTGDHADSCINDGIETTETNTSATANGTITFTNCSLSNGTKINGSITVDFSANKDGENGNVRYSGSGHLSVISEDGQSEISISDAKTEGTFDLKLGNEDTSEVLGGKADNKFGISAFFKDSGKKILILDGINTHTTADWGQDNSAYTFTVAGFIGSDDIGGMLKVATPTKVEGNGERDCPNTGKITLTDATNSIFTIKSNGTTVTTDIDGNVTNTYNCGGSAAEPEAE